MYFLVENLWFHIMKDHIVCRQAFEGRARHRVCQQITSSHHFIIIKKFICGNNDGIHCVTRSENHVKHTYECLNCGHEILDGFDKGSMYYKVIILKN
jgi:hypothetical protein